MRRAQLVRVAGPLIARDGVAEFSLDEVAERSGVTRNLLYRYFPRGRIDLFVEVLEDVMPALTEQATEPRLSRARMRAANIERLSHHAFAPTWQWQVYTEALGLRDGAVTDALGRFHGVWAARVALNNGVVATPQMVSALSAFRSAAVRLFEESRHHGHDREWTKRLLSRLLDTTITAAAAEPETTT